MPEDPDDAALLDRIRRGDEPAFRELVRRHGRYLFGVARLLVRDDGEAEDVVQETFAAVLNANFRGESAVKTWLVGIAARQAAKARQKRRLWLRRPDPPADAGPSGELAIDAKLDVAAMLERLSPEHREAIVLRELEGMSYDDIARELGVPRGTVESRLHRAREQLRKLFEE